MKIGNREKFTRWHWSTFYPLPSISLHFDKGTICNYDTGRVQKFIDCELYFDFLWFHALIYPIVMWGDEGEVNQEER